MPNELAVIDGAAIQPYDGGRLPAVQQLGAMLAKSGYFADAREAAQAAVKVMAGEELGLAPVASMMGINIIKGKVALSANLMAAQVRRHGYNYRVKQMDNSGAVIEFIAKDGKSVLGESAFSESDAKAAEIKGDMYKKYPRNMYFSRAMSNGVKWFCPEVTSGMPIYTPEELGAAVDGNGEMIQRINSEVSAAMEPPIDTGGAPIGTQAAADAVAQRKIAEMKQNGAAKSKDFSMLKAFKEIKPKIGTEAYYRILGNNGHEKSDQITDSSKGRDIYREMQACLKAQQERAAEEMPAHQAAQPAADMAATEGDVWPEGRD